VDHALLSGPELDRLLGAELTYPEVGETAGPLPTGYHHLTEQAVIGHGPAALDQAAGALFTWQLQRRSGVRVQPSTESVLVGSVAVLTLGPGRLRVQAPVRALRVVDEPTRRGFAYGTLPGHPERGEEAFVLDLVPGGAVVLTITAFSRPASLPARLSGPVGRRAQWLVTRRYLRALRT